MISATVTEKRTSLMKTTPWQAQATTEGLGDPMASPGYANADGNLMGWISECAPKFVVFPTQSILGSWGAASVLGSRLWSPSGNCGCDAKNVGESAASGPKWTAADKGSAPPVKLDWRRATPKSHVKAEHCILPDTQKHYWGTCAHTLVCTHIYTYMYKCVYVYVCICFCIV